MYGNILILIYVLKVFSALQSILSIHICQLHVTMMCIMIVTAEDDMDEHVPSSVLTGIKEKLVVTDLINQLDIADGLKELLMGGGFTLKSLLNASASDLAKILSIDDYVAKLVSDAVNKAIKTSRSIA